MDNKGRTVLETVMALMIIGILLFGALAYIQKASKIAKEYALMSEISNIRSSSMVYMAVNKRFPESLEQLVREKVMVPFNDPEAMEELEDMGIAMKGGGITISRSYLEKVSVDEDGNILDPFGNPYDYDPDTGMVRSPTPGYGNW